MGGSWGSCLFSLASTALLIEKKDLGMIRGGNLAEKQGKAVPGV